MITRTTWGQEKQEDVTLYLFYEFEAYVATTISFITSTEEAMENHVNDIIKDKSIAFDAYFSIGRFNQRGILETESVDAWVVVHESTDDLGQMPKRYRVFLNRNRALEWMKEQRDRMPDNVKTTHLWNEPFLSTGGDYFEGMRYPRYFKGFAYDYKTYTVCGEYTKRVCNERFTIESFLGGGSLS